MSRSFLGELPAQWVTAPVDQIAHIVYGKALPAERRTGEGGVSVVGSSGIVGEHNEALYSGPSIVIGRKGTVGSIHYISGPSWTIDTAFYLDWVSSYVDIEFLSLVLDYIDLSRLAIVVGVPGISRKDIENVRIPLPPLPEQRRIVTILWQADELRRLRRRADERAQQLGPAVFREMFGDPATNPRNWETIQLRDCQPFITSGSRGWAQYYSPYGAKFVRVQNLTEHRLDQADLAFVEPPNTAEAARAKVQPGDLLISITGVVGLVAAAPKDIGDAYISQHVAIVRLGEGIDPIFAAAYLADEAGGQRQIKTLAYGQIKPGLGLDDIRSLKIFVPPLALQQEYAAQVERLWEIRRKQDLASLRLKDLSESLLAQAFSGKLTAAWREEHGEELAQAAAERDEALARQDSEPRQPKHYTVEIGAVVAMTSDVQVTVQSRDADRPSTRAVYADLDSADRRLLDATATRPAYFRPVDLERDGVSLAEVEEGLRLLDALGFVRQVRVEGQPLYRAVAPTDERALPDGLDA